MKMVPLVILFLVASTARAADAPPILSVTTHSGKKQREVRLVRFDNAAYTLRVVVDADANGRVVSGNLARVLEATGGLAGCNGGFFNHQPFEPCALLIRGGKTLRGPINDAANWMHGVIAAEAGRLRLIPVTSFDPAHPPDEALQSGPWLIRNGRPVAGLDRQRSARRSFILHDGATGWALGVADACTLAELPDVLLDPAVTAVLPTQSALNLDGGPSCALWSRDPASAPLRIRSFDSVHNYLVIFPR
ncbi:MAG: phosphodiester glycosidase family protein [Candidatus Methylacidiphilales bacterium]|nr:phosphodiester glycosidase family protein [Candidatus Methylacidiphilales bacterium]